MNEVKTSMECRLRGILNRLLEDGGKLCAVAEGLTQKMSVHPSDGPTASVAPYPSDVDSLVNAIEVEVANVISRVAGELDAIHRFVGDFTPAPAVNQLASGIRK